MNSQNAEIEFCDRIETCDLCIVGAGIAGLNALYVASKYLSKKDKVILLDKNPTVGGMWNETYDYVRLHQPHAMFTAGDIKWTINREPSYLASKDEVLAHFAHCVEYLRTRVTLIERYGWLYEQHTEVPTEGGYEAHIVCRLAASDSPPCLIKAKRCIKAIGMDIKPNSPISFSSNNILSVAPQDERLFGPQMDKNEKPIYIIGGGKIRMAALHDPADSAADHHIAERHGGEILLIVADTKTHIGIERKPQRLHQQLSGAGFWNGGLAQREIRFFGIAVGPCRQNELPVYFRSHGLRSAAYAVKCTLMRPSAPKSAVT
jgi:thioredoxin reductase